MKKRLFANVKNLPRKRAKLREAISAVGIDAFSRAAGISALTARAIATTDCTISVRIAANIAGANLGVSFDELMDMNGVRGKASPRKVQKRTILTDADLKDSKKLEKKLAPKQPKKVSILEEIGKEIKKDVKKVKKKLTASVKGLVKKKAAPKKK